MNLLNLPPEILRLIVQQYYAPWSIYLKKPEAADEDTWRSDNAGFPSCNLFYVCHILSDLARESEAQSFTGVLRVEESSSKMGITYEDFISSVTSIQRLKWLSNHVHTIKFSYPSRNPATWKFYKDLFNTIINTSDGQATTQSSDDSHRLSGPRFLKRVELDCRYPYHFKTHNVQSTQDFLAGKEGRLDRDRDFRQSFFFSCEKFLNAVVRCGIIVTVVRTMGVREGRDRCQAVMVAVDYIDDGTGQLCLHWDSPRTRRAPINGWPHNIRQTIEALQFAAAE